MKIFINRKETDTAGMNVLADILSHHNLKINEIAVAVNNKVVPRPRWTDTLLNEGDKLTIITAVCGG
ncbi:MAG: sulfur carrier protein ThiS [Muribaculaceae bacterium]|nr:sulfur carrier protein ThiS [Muribaculaceae bacterium]MDE6792885.1 sulfur carrier protein ThiS [Muribaculaceae bacterium]